MAELEPYLGFAVTRLNPIRVGDENMNIFKTALVYAALALPLIGTAQAADNQPSPGAMAGARATGQAVITADGQKRPSGFSGHRVHTGRSMYRHGRERHHMQRHHMKRHSVSRHQHRRHHSDM
jgi:hypothetical protein